ncbi:MAG: hypothetical protein LBH43_17515 [Treponema sp.]|nr:hypothetical protein [Treponema sp.]
MKKNLKVFGSSFAFFELISSLMLAVGCVNHGENRVGDVDKKSEVVKTLEALNLPDVLSEDGKWTPERRKEVLDLLMKYEYGNPPPPPESMSYEVKTMYELEGYDLTDSPYTEPPHVDPPLKTWFAGDANAVFRKVKAICTLSDASFPGVTGFPEAGNKFEFYISCYYPKLAVGEKAPAVVQVDFRDSFDPGYVYIQPLLERGVAIFSFRYRHIVQDYNDIRLYQDNRLNPTGVDRLYYGDYRLAYENTKGLPSGVPAKPNGNPARAGDAPGTIAFWAWGASRVMDFIETECSDFIDLDHVAVSGFSRTGKAALVAAALDERFTHVLANASGVGGASLSLGNRKQTLRDMADNLYIQWFCRNLKQYYNNKLFDQHFLLAAIAPRKIYLANGDRDPYADLNSEFLSCVAASEVYKSLGYAGFIHPGRLPKLGNKFTEGDIGFHVLSRDHTILPDDWGFFLDFFLAKK